MDRRNFIRLGITSAVGTLVVPRSILAAGQSIEPGMAGGVFYTREAPGRWNKKVSSHLPNIEIDKKPEGTVIQVETRHTFDGYNHYIVKHVVLDKDYGFVDEHMFDPLKDEHPLSTFTLQDYSGPVFVLSVCNVHDTWLNSAVI